MIFKGEIRQRSARKLTAQYPFSIFRLADSALSAAGKANKKKTPEATEAFLRVQEEMERFGSPPPRKDSGAPGDHRKRLPDPRIALATASKKDEQSGRSFISKIMKSKSPAPVSHLS